MSAKVGDIIFDYKPSPLEVLNTVIPQQTEAGGDGRPPQGH